MASGGKALTVPVTTGKPEVYIGLRFEAGAAYACSCTALDPGRHGWARGNQCETAVAEQDQTWEFVCQLQGRKQSEALPGSSHQ